MKLDGHEATCLCFIAWGMFNHNRSHAENIYENLKRPEVKELALAMMDIMEGKNLGPHEGAEGVLKYFLGDWRNDGRFTMGRETQTKDN